MSRNGKRRSKTLYESRRIQLWHNDRPYTDIASGRLTKRHEVNLYVLGRGRWRVVKVQISGSGYRQPKAIEVNTLLQSRDKRESYGYKSYFRMKWSLGSIGRITVAPSAR